MSLLLRCYYVVVYDATTLSSTALPRLSSFEPRAQARKGLAGRAGVGEVGDVEVRDLHGRASALVLVGHLSGRIVQYLYEHCWFDVNYYYLYGLPCSTLGRICPLGTCPRGSTWLRNTARTGRCRACDARPRGTQCASHPPAR